MNKPLPPGSRIGILGGGQLGRMTAVAAAQLGYRTVIFEPQEDCPASHVSDHIAADYRDKAALERFAQSVDVITLEFENVPVESLEYLARRVPVRPGAHVLEIAQDRALEKKFLNDSGIDTAPWRPVNDLGDLERAVAEIGRPSVLKTARLGYDGKGQVKIDADTNLATAWAEMNGARAILEGFVEFRCEVSVIAARGTDGSIACFDVVENRHRNHILDVTIAPAPDLSSETVQAAIEVAEKAIRRFDAIGLLAVEMFVTGDGRVLANEVAPRPHNSGHWTIEGANTSQFEQLVRAVCGLPLGDTGRIADAEMKNLIGDEADAWLSILSEPGAHLHLYGKAESRPGRKMGHVTRLKKS